jgi:MFS transporter, PAT family, beta-lactamase induction signal transducer AmpG
MPARRAGLTVLGAARDRLMTFLRELYAGFFQNGAGPIAGVVLAMLPHGAMGLGLALGTGIPVDMKMSEQSLGNLTLLNNVAGGAGAFLGGWLSDRTGTPRIWIAVSFLLSCAVSVALGLWMAGTGVAGLRVYVFVAAITLYQFAFGIQMGALTGTFMRISSRAVAATQFTGFMALSNLSYSYSNLWQGRFVDLHGYASTLQLDALTGLTGLTILYWVRTREEVSAGNVPATPWRFARRLLWGNGRCDG